MFFTSLDPLQIEQTEDTPGIILNRTEGTFEISGRSLPEDSADFYEPVLAWLRAYADAPNDKTVFEFKLEYSNTASSKYIHEVLKVLQSISGAKVNWWFHKDDEDLEEMGIELSEQVEVPFSLKIYE
jgi:hypothetical protein